ncbi:hypothetical protein NQ176_g6633 [Zarea fungicola]|uniref:Uncharacterized protein n=1 Tax=Zarea fungicola TaxID=93591 RepID=A0ACC1N302_9HYPO|nr:hypothetical protein NQ176_g6633 [Lecanicillium fungicola]
MKKNYDEVRRVVAEERRIEWKVQDGWEPLCRHLGVDVPMVEDEKTGKMVVAPFPRVNDRESFKKMSKNGMDIQVAQANALLYGLMGKGVAVGAIGYALFMAWKAYGDSKGV